MLTIRDCKMILTYGSMRIRVDKEEKLKRWGEYEIFHVFVNL